MKKPTQRDHLKIMIAKNLSNQLFQYKCLKVNLEPDTKSLTVEIQTTGRFDQFPLNFECLFELESLMAWLNQHLEVKSVQIEFDVEYQSFYPEQLKDLDQAYLEKNMLQIRKTCHSLLKLPQTVIFNLKRGLEGPMAELALAADLRVANRDCEIVFNHLSLGLVPMGLGIELLGLIVSPGKARDWILSGRNISSYELAQSGFIGQLIDNEEDCQQIKQKLFSHSDMARIQAKEALLHQVRGFITDLGLAIQKEALKTGDLALAIEARASEKTIKFTNPNEFKARLKSKLSTAEL